MTTAAVLLAAVWLLGAVAAWLAIQADDLMSPLEADWPLAVAVALAWPAVLAAMVVDAWGGRGHE